MQASRPIDQNAAIDALRKQREIALDNLAQAEGHITFLMQQLAAREQKIAELENKVQKQDQSS